jgi:uncharacterized oxidoreductase
MNWTSRTVLVTGGTRGIGRELVLGLLQRGATVVATGATARSVAAAAAALPAVQWCVCDLRSPSSRQQLAETLRGRRLSDAIHNAGVQQLRDFGQDGRDEAVSLQDEVDTNLVGAIDLARLLLPELRATAAPSMPSTLVFVTSGLALAPKRSSPVYCATKAGLRSFAKALRAQVRSQGPEVRVIEALPPIVDTDMTRGRGARKMSPDAAAEQMLAGIAAGKDEIYIGASALLKWILRVSPALGERIMLDR